MSDKEIDKLSWRLADYLETQPSGSIFSTSELLRRACNAKPVRDQETNYPYYYLDDGSTIDEGEEMSKLHVYFHAEAEVRGYIFDGIYNWGKKLGQPYNLREVIYSKGDLLSKVKSKTEWLMRGRDHKEFSIREAVMSANHFDGKRVFQLITLTKGTATGLLDVKAMKTMLIGIAGKGVVRSSGLLLRDHILGTDIHNGSSNTSLLDDHFQISCFSTELKESENSAWIEIENTRDEDLQVLLIRELDTWPTIHE